MVNFLLWVLWFLYLGGWFLLLLHCIGRKDFYPVVGRGWRTKLFWLATFLFFNPFLTLIYFVMGFSLKPPEGENRRHSAFAAITTVTLVVIIVVAFHLLPSVQPVAKVIPGRKSTEERSIFNSTPLKTGMYIGSLSSRSESNIFMTSSSNDFNSVACRRIAVMCSDSHPVITRAGRAVQEKLAEMPGVESVALYPPGSSLESGNILPQLIVEIGLEKKKVIPLPLGRSSEFIISVKGGNKLWKGEYYWYEIPEPEVVSLEIGGTLTFKGLMKGLETRNYCYIQEGTKIGNEIAGLISERLYNLVRKEGMLPKLPAALQVEYRDTPEVTFPEGVSVKEVFSGNDIMTYNHTVWEVAVNGDATSTIKTWYEMCTSEAWSPGRLRKDIGFHVRRGNEWLVVSREKTSSRVKPDDVTDDTLTRYYVHYYNLLSDDEFKSSVDSVLREDQPVEILLSLYPRIEEPDLKSRLIEKLFDAGSNSYRVNIVLSRFWFASGKNDLACDALLKAFVLSYARPGGVKLVKLPSIAEGAGVKDLLELPIDEEVFHSVGFSNIADIGEGIEVECSIDEPILFYMHGNDGMIETVALSIVEKWDSTTDYHYALQVVKSNVRQSEWSCLEGRKKPDGRWEIEETIHMINWENMFQVRAHSISEDKFLISITPKSQGV